MSISHTPFQRLFASTSHVTTTAAAAANTCVTTAGVQFSWPELTLEGPFANASTGRLQPLTDAVATLDHNILRCLFSLSTAQRRGLWLALLSTGVVVSAYVGYVCVWPCVKQGVDTYVWDTYLALSIPSVARKTTAGAADPATAALAMATPPTTDEASPTTTPPIAPRLPASQPSNDVGDHRADTSAGPTGPTASSALSITLPSVFQRALDAVRSHQLTSKAATATTVLLERQDHQWFATLREHVSTGAAIVGVSVRVPATLCLAPTDEVVTLNRWLEVDVRRAPPSDSPVCLWSNDVGDTSNTDVDSGDAHPADDAAAAPPDGLHLSALLRDVVGHQFERQHQPLPALQYRVHNQLCAPENATRYGLEVATIVAGVVCGCALAAPGAESPLATHASLTSWAASDVAPRCEREWTVYTRERATASAGADSPLPAPPSPEDPTRSPLAVQSRIAAALWESDDDDDEADDDDGPGESGADVHAPLPEEASASAPTPTLDADADAADAAVAAVAAADANADAAEASVVAAPTPATPPIVVCGQLCRDQRDVEGGAAESPTDWPTDAIAQTLAQHLDEVLGPASSSRPTLHINAEGELYVLAHAPIGLTVKQLLVQACEAHGCALQLHCLARVYRAGTAATCKVRQTWASSVELV